MDVRPEDNFIIDTMGVRIDYDGQWHINNNIRKSDTGDEIILHIKDVEDLNYSEVLHILTKANELELPSILLIHSNVVSPEFDLSDVVYDQDLLVARLNKDKILFKFGVTTPSNSKLNEEYYFKRISPLEKRKNLQIAEIDDIIFDDYTHECFAFISVAVKKESLQISEIAKEVCEFKSLIEATAGNSLSQNDFIDIVRSGQIESLLGQEENDWLEVKSRHFHLDSNIGKYDFLKSVAQFANSDLGGVLLIGAKTFSLHGRDTIEKITPIQVNADSSKIKQKYASILRSNIFPPIKNLKIEEISSAEGLTMLIIIPSQPEELKPFLIHGEILDGKIVKNYISFVERNGDSSYTYSPQSIHSMLAAGRSMLRSRP